MAAAAQAPLWSISNELRKAGCTGKSFTPMTKEDWKLALRLCNGLVQYGILQFIWFQTWEGNSGRKGDPPPLYSQPTSYAQMASFAGCTRKNAEDEAKLLVKWGMIEVLDAETAAKLGLPKPTATSAKQYRVMYAKWPALKRAERPKLELVAEPEEAEGPEEKERVAAAGPTVELLPGQKREWKDANGWTGRVWNKSTAARVNVERGEMKLSIVVMDAESHVVNKGLKVPAIPQQGDSAAVGAKSAGVGHGGAQHSPDSSNSRVATSGVNGSTIPLQQDSDFAEFYGLFENAGVALNQGDKTYAWRMWRRVAALDRPLAIAHAREQFNNGPWFDVEFAARPGNYLISMAWTRKAAPGANGNKKAARATQKAPALDVSAELAKMRREGKLA
jgi:hypothetical protein